MKVTVIVPAGTYWLGDPCYSIPDHEWLEWLRAADCSNEDRLLRASLKDGNYAVGVSTAHGDGQYSDQYSRVYYVDSGMIGLVNVVWAPDLKEEKNVRYKVTFDKPVEVSWNTDGVIEIGGIYIATDDWATDEGYYYDMDD